jgi:hypothetical protein
VLDEADAAGLHAARYLHTRFEDDGSYRINGRLAPDTGAVVDKALEIARQELADASASREDSFEATTRTPWRTSPTNPWPAAARETVPSPPR